MKRKIDSLAENLAQKKQKNNSNGVDAKFNIKNLLNVKTSATNNNCNNNSNINSKQATAVAAALQQQQQQQQLQLQLLNSQALLGNLFPNSPVNLLSLLAQQQQQQQSSSFNNSTSNAFASLLANPSLFAVAMAMASKAQPTASNFKKL